MGRGQRLQLERRHEAMALQLLRGPRVAAVDALQAREFAAAPPVQ